MANTPDEHWSATSFHIKVGPFPPSFFIPVLILPFYHPTPFILLSLAWMGTTYWLAKRGLGLGGIGLLLRRWVQGGKLRPRRKMS